MCIPAADVLPTAPLPHLLAERHRLPIRLRRGRQAGLRRPPRAGEVCAQHLGRRRPGAVGDMRGAAAAGPVPEDEGCKGATRGERAGEGTEDLAEGLGVGVLRGRIWGGLRIGREKGGGS